jgi:Ca2+-binding RTX toxin-like protein
MRRRLGVLLVSMALAVLLVSGVALALPSETPDNTLMVNGPVLTFAQVGSNLWVGGNFTQVLQRDGTVVANVSNVAVFDLTTGNYVDIAPMLGAGNTNSSVTEIKVYNNDVVIGGKFAGPTSTQKNLVVVDGTTGVTPETPARWFNAPNLLEALLTAPDLGVIYVGAKSLTAFDFATGNKLWTQAEATVDSTLRSHPLQAGYRDLERDGSTIWAACACDAIKTPDGTTFPTRSLVKLSTEGAYNASWDPINNVGPGGQTGGDSWGISLVNTTDKLYLGTGGSDFLAEYPKANNGAISWKRDTSGSTQAVEEMDGQLVVGGHFWEVADQAGDSCGARSSNNAVTLDPNDECQTRKGLAAYSYSGALDPNWDPALSGHYNLAWALHPENGRLHVGGEFTKVNGVTQSYYARFSDAQAPPPCTITGTSNSETLTGTSGDDIICAGGGNDTLKGLEGNDTLKGEGGADKLLGGIGDDTLDGGTGTDTADFSGSPAAVSASLVDNTATGEGSDTLVGIENLAGSNANDTLIGSETNNTLNGNSGDDSIGDDSIVGQGGADILKGASGNDTLDSRDGVDGNDTLDGGGGTEDTCTTDATEKSILNCER